MRHRLSPLDACAQIGHAGRLAPRKHFEGQHIVQPVVTGAVGILGGDGYRVVLRSEPAFELKIDVEFLARFENAQIHLLDPRVCAVNFHPDAIADEDTDHRFDAPPPERRSNPDGDPLAAGNDSARLTVFADQTHFENLARSVSVPVAGGETALPAALLERLLPLEHHADVLVDDVLRLALGLDTAIEEKDGPVRQAASQGRGRATRKGP